MHIKENLNYCQQEWELTSVKEYLDTPSSTLFTACYQNKNVILKIFKEESDEANSYVALKAYDGVGAVRVLEHCNAVILLNRIDSARELAELTKTGNDNEATTIFCDILKKLHSRNTDSIQLPSLIHLAKGFERYKE